MFGYINNKSIYLFVVIMILVNLLSGGFNLLSLVLTLPGVLIAITFHEFAHAYVADRLGDDTPRRQGRVNLNPTSHLDPIGFIMLLFAGIGWGKPVEISPRKFNRKVSMSAGEAMVALAGPVMNLLLAIVFTIIYYAVAKFGGPIFAATQLGTILLLIIRSAMFVNIGLSVFNLLPVPPLDGSKILMHFLPYNAKVWVQDHMMLFYLGFIIIWITPLSSLIISPCIQAIQEGLDLVIGGLFSLF